MNAKVATIFSLFAPAFVAMACQPGETNTNTTTTASNCLGCGSAGSGAGGDTSSSTSSSTGNAGSGSGGSAANVCVPSAADYNCTAQSYDACQCAVMDTTNEAPGEWCQGALEMGIDICPGPPLNTCTPGHNQCSYDLPPGVDYEPADDSCFPYVQNSTWMDANGYSSSSFLEYLPNGMVRTGVSGLLNPSNGYFHGFLMSGKKLYYNMGNAATADSAEGEFSPDCTSITVTFTYYGGGSSQETVNYSHPN